ncbi:MAG: hypothetical protein IKN86_04275 [Bacteroidaceae bacterium]|nr:hypothetical protein [Bacteroidaceae bacterium]
MAKHYKKSRDIMSMSDKEFEKLIDEVAGPKAENVEMKPDPRFTERHNGATPYGGDYSIAYFYDDNHNPCVKEKAKYVNIVIFNNDGSRINEVYGCFGE